MNKVASRGLAFQAVAVSGSTALTQAIMAAVYVLVARSMSPGDFGIVVSSIALGAVIAGVLDFGTNSYWVRQLARNSLPPVKYFELLRTKVLLALIFCLIWSAVFYIVLDHNFYWTSAPVAMAMVLNQGLQVGLRAAARGELLALTVVSERVAVSGALGLMAYFLEDWPRYLWLAIVAGAFISAIISAFLAPAAYKYRTKSISISNPWIGAYNFGWSSMSSSAQSLDVTILAMVGGPASAGIYGAVSRWTQPMGLLASAFATTSAPFVARSRGFNEAWGYMRRAIWLPVSAVFACLLVILAAPFVVDILIGNAYEDSAVVLQVLAAGTILAVVNQPLSVMLQGLGRDKFVAIVSVIGLVGQLGAVSVFGAMLGAVGGAIAFCMLQIWMFSNMFLKIFNVRKVDVARSEWVSRYAEI